VLRRPDANNQFVFDRCREVQAAPDGFIDVWARYHYKSTIITFALTIQDILNNPELTFGIFSFTKTSAQGFLKQIKNEFEANELLKWAFDDILWENVSDAPEWSQDGIVVKRRGNPKEATIGAWGLIDGMPTGLHYQCLIYDDVVTDKNVTTPEQIKKTTAAWGLSRALGPGAGKDGITRIIGTRYHYFDSYSEIMKRGFKVRKYAATKDGKVDGEPWMMTREQLQQTMLEMQEQFSPQMMQEPRLAQDAFFKPEWWRRFTKLPQYVNYYIGCDLAVTAGGGDETVFVVIGICQQGLLHVVDIWVGQTDSHEWGLKLIGMIETYKPMAVGMPKDNIWKASSPFVMQLMHKHKCYPYIVEITEAGADKPTKASSFRGLAANGRVYLPSADIAEDGYTPPVWLADLEAELLMFPMGKRDNRVDALSIVGRLLDVITDGHEPEKPVTNHLDDYVSPGGQDARDEDNWKLA
jgi:phage terminase large subunit-like protein